MMKLTFVSLFAMAVVFGTFTAGSTAAAQTHPDLSGLWYAPTPDITVALLAGTGNLADPVWCGAIQETGSGGFTFVSSVCRTAPRGR